MDKKSLKPIASKKIHIDSKVWFWFGILLLLAINTQGLSKMKVPTIIYDEIGYWADAAFFLGYDWTGVTSSFSYYSYGLGILLSLIMRITSNMVLVYRLVMVLNVILMLLMYVMSYQIAKFLYSNAPCLIISLACTISLSYPTYMTNIGIAWSEYYMLFMTLLLIYLFVSILKKENSFKVIIYSISLWYLYSIHQRNIGILLIGILAIIYLYYKKKLPLRDLFIALGISVLAYGAHKYIKDSIINAFWPAVTEGEATAEYSVNDYSGRINNFIFSFKNAGIISLVESVIGKIYYLTVSTCGIYVLSIVSCLRAIKEKFLLKSSENEKQNETIIYIHLFMATLLLITSVSTMYDGVSPTRRGDSLIYGRYMESLLAPLIMIGVLEFFEKIYPNKIYFCLIGLTAVLSLFLSHIYNNGNYNETLFASCVGGVIKYYFDSGLFDFISEGTLITILTFLVLFSVKASKKKEMYIFFLAAVISIFIINGNCLNKNSRDKIQAQNQVMIPLAEHIKASNQNVPIYCIRGNMPYAHMYLGVLQYLLPDYKCSYIEDDIKINGTEYYICVEDFNNIDVNNYYQVFASDMGWHVMVRKDSNLYQYYQE